MMGRVVCKHCGHTVAAGHRVVLDTKATGNPALRDNVRYGYNEPPADEDTKAWEFLAREHAPDCAWALRTAVPPENEPPNEPTLNLRVMPAPDIEIVDPHSIETDDDDDKEQ